MEETHSVGRRKPHLVVCMEFCQLKFILVASTVSPKVEDISGANIYRQDPHTSGINIEFGFGLFSTQRVAY